MASKRTADPVTGSERGLVRGGSVIDRDAVAAGLSEDDVKEEDEATGDSDDEPYIDEERKVGEDDKAPEADAAAEAVDRMGVLEPNCGR